MQLQTRRVAKGPASFALVLLTVSAAGLTACAEEAVDHRVTAEVTASIVTPVVAESAETATATTSRDRPVAPSAPTDQAVVYVPLDAATFVQPLVIDAWIHRQPGPDHAAVWDHAWNLWRALNRPTGQALHETPLPVWETWYSEGDVFLRNEEVTDADSRDLNAPQQSLHAGELAVPSIHANPATVLSFNRYNRQILDHVQQNRYYDRRVLVGLRDQLDLVSAPPAARDLVEFPNTSVMLKPVWWIVPGDKPSTMPFWAGAGADASTDARNPDWKTWRQCVLVDPTGAANNSVARTCNDGYAGQGPMAAGSYPVLTVDTDPAKSDFYAFRLTEDEVAGLAQFKLLLSNSNLEETPELAEAGDYAMLVAMHVSTREIADWTWQTFWWTPQPTLIPSSPPHAQRPPSTVPAPWNHFQMCAAYFMTDPAHKGATGEPWLCFNPYLETNLTGLSTADRTLTDDVGIHSNCMTCHRAAQFSSGKRASYGSNGPIDTASAAWFADGVRTQFLWSLASLAHEPPFVRPGPPLEVAPAVGQH